MSGDGRGQMRRRDTGRYVVTATAAAPATGAGAGGATAGRREHPVVNRVSTAATAMMLLLLRRWRFLEVHVVALRGGEVGAGLGGSGRIARRHGRRRRGGVNLLLLMLLLLLRVVVDL